MFKGTIDRERLPAPNGQRQSFQSPAARIDILDHPLLESFRWETPEGTILLCRERCAGPDRLGRPRADWTMEQAQAFCAAHQQWPLDHQSISIDSRTGTATLSAGHGGVAPLYIRVAGARIDLSWSIADFYPDLDLDDVDVERTGLRLTGTLPYAATTMFRSVFMVTERASLTIHNDGAVKVTYPAPAEYYVPSPLRDDADIAAAARGLVDALLQRWPLKPYVVASEFSGGLDSAVVAAILAARHPGLPTYALEIGGAAQSQQIGRRALAIDHFGFQDMLLPVGAVPMVPSAFARHADYEAAPYNADLQRPLGRLLKAFVAASGARVVATGTGGDELLMAHAFEQEPEQLARNVSDAFLPEAFPPALSKSLRDRLADYAAHCDRAPFPVLPISVLEAQAARAPLFAAHGLWPVSPFAQPEAVRFYRSLPLAWRQHKILHRRLLRHLGYPEPFLGIPLRENFEPYLTTSLVTGAGGIARDLTRSCRLHELGLVDADRLIAAVRAIRPHSSLGDVGFLFHAFNVEYMLRRLDEPRSAGTLRAHAGRDRSDRSPQARSASHGI